jgi:hypothetical protein
VTHVPLMQTLNDEVGDGWGHRGRLSESLGSIESRTVPPWGCSCVLAEARIPFSGTMTPRFC